MANRVRGRHTGVPGFFRACCREASRGGLFGYDHPAHELCRALVRQMPLDVDPDEWQEELDLLGRSLEDEDGDAALAWFDDHFLKCMNLIPPRRREMFLAGVYRAFADETIDLAVPKEQAADVPPSLNTTGPRETLYAKLLAIGGERVVPMPDPHIDILLGRGEVFGNAAVKRVRGEPNRCHQNVALRHLLSRGRLKICTGYALSEDGLWRQHSWLHDGERVLETTVARRVYFGVRLDPVEAAPFVLGEVIPLLPGAQVFIERAAAAA
jgi:hypothetical protein